MAEAIEILQLYPLPPAFEAELAAAYRVHRWHDEVDRARLKAGGSARIRAIVTGGHLGMIPVGALPLPALEIIAVNGVGTDKIELGPMRARGVRVTNTPGVLTEDVADLAVALLLALARRVPAADAYVRSGQWATLGDFPLTRRASGLRYGIAGLGNIGSAVARRLQGFGGTIAYTSRRPRADAAYRFVPSLLDLAAQSDALILCVPGGDDTRHMADAAVLDALGPGGWLVNVARGSVVDQPALLAALREGRLGGAALDVFDDEPAIDPDLLWNDSLVLSPHVASATRECRKAMADLVLANLARHFAGLPLVSPVA